MLIYNYNPAWYYAGPGALFHGNIKLTYAPAWFVLGIGFEFGIVSTFIL
jgi:hypothetical protein